MPIRKKHIRFAIIFVQILICVFLIFHIDKLFFICITNPYLLMLCFGIAVFFIYLILKNDKKLLTKKQKILLNLYLFANIFFFIFLFLGYLCNVTLFKPVADLPLFNLGYWLPQFIIIGEFTKLIIDNDT